MGFYLHLIFNKILRRCASNPVALGYETKTLTCCATSTCTGNIWTNSAQRKIIPSNNFEQVPSNFNNNISKVARCQRPLSQF